MADSYHQIKKLNLECKNVEEKEVRQNLEHLLSMNIRIKNNKKTDDHRVLKNPF